MNRKPFLDKIAAKENTPVPLGNHDANIVTVFPDLKHTGIRSIYEPKSTVVANPDGRVTFKYKVESFDTMRNIYRDEIELNSRESTFKRSHKQFLDNILLDMEGKKTDQMTRQMKYWKSNKDSMGFSDQFNTATLSSADHNISLDHNKSVHFDESSHPQTSYPNTAEGNRLSLISRGSMASRSSLDSRSSIMSKDRRPGFKPFSRMSLFNSLVDHVEPPKTPIKRYGTVNLRDTL